MTLPYHENTLREMELWSYLALARPQNPDVPAERATVEAPARGNPAMAANRQPAVPRAGAPTAARVVVPSAPPAPIDPARAANIATLDWDGLVRESSACHACGLCRQRKQAVLGVGAQNAPWLLIGEGPGADEDEQGEPFVGAAGKLLDAMLTAIGLQRGREVYIANVVKCRPPGNRTPSTDEALACAPFLDRQIDLIQPKMIIALGKTAVTRLTGSDASMASLRGKMHQYRDIPMIATYHPAYLLRNLPDKVKAWEDLMFAKRAFVTASR